jgi:hypothetical protein
MFMILSQTLTLEISKSAQRQKLEQHVIVQALPWRAKVFSWRARNSASQRWKLGMNAQIITIQPKP